ncbi:MAG: hypothetical protein ACLTZT_03245 [Butyricimonas faecalis]
MDYLFNMASAENQFRFEELVHKYKPINLTSNDPYLSQRTAVLYVGSIQYAVRAG